MVRRDRSVAIERHGRRIAKATVADIDPEHPLGARDLHLVVLRVVPGDHLQFRRINELQASDPVSGEPERDD